MFFLYCSDFLCAEWRAFLKCTLHIYIITLKFHTLQLYRFIAALLVMFHHLDITRSGNNGVYIFFVISGFVIYLKLFSPDRPTPFQFFRNRITKIFFLYWVALFILSLLLPFPLDSSAIKTILLLPGHISRITVSWSLSYELYFYFLTATIAYLLPPKYAKAVLFLLLINATIVSILYTGGWIQIKSSFLNFCLGKNTGYFCLGLLSGHLSTTSFKSARLPLILPALILVTILLSAAFIFPSDNLFTVLVTGALSTGLVCFSAVYELSNPLPAKRALVFGILGDASYAIYLFAPIVGALVPGRNPLEKIIIVLLTVSISVLVNRFIEVPGLIFCRRMLTGVKPVRVLSEF